MNTSSIRQAFLKKRRSLDRPTQDRASALALKQFQQHSSFAQAQRIASFWAIRGEMPTQALNQLLIDQHRQVFLPHPDPHHQHSLVFVEYQQDTPFERDQFGIPVPVYSEKNIHNPATFDLILIPLVAVDTLGNRVGMGKGFYDRTLNKIQNAHNAQSPRPLLVGWCYEWQVTPEPLHPQPWDVPLDALITEQTIRWFTPNSTR